MVQLSPAGKMFSCCGDGAGAGGIVSPFFSIGVAVTRVVRLEIRNESEGPHVLRDVRLFEIARGVSGFDGAVAVVLKMPCRNAGFQRHSAQ